MKIDMNKKMDIDMDGQGHEDIDEDIETWTRTWQHGRGYGNTDEDMATWTRI
jgi:hypothetical protein